MAPALQAIKWTCQCSTQRGDLRLQAPDAPAPLLAGGHCSLALQAHRCLHAAAGQRCRSITALHQYIALNAIKLLSTATRVLFLGGLLHVVPFRWLFADGMLVLDAPSTKCLISPCVSAPIQDTASWGPKCRVCSRDQLLLLFPQTGAFAGHSKCSWRQGDFQHHPCKATSCTSHRAALHLSYQEHVIPSAGGTCSKYQLCLVPTAFPCQVHITPPAGGACGGCQLVPVTG